MYNYLTGCMFEIKYEIAVTNLDDILYGNSNLTVESFSWF